MDDLQEAKSLVLNTNAALDIANPGESASALFPYVASDYL